MGRKESMPKNNLVDVPWDHYTFNLGGNADLQPQLRRKVELIETEFTFCMLYPKNRRRKGHSSNNKNNRSAPIKSRAETETEGRDPNASCKSESTYDSAEGSPIHPDAASYRQNHHHHRKYPVSSPELHRKKGRNKNELEGNSNHQISYSSRSYR